jgi:hypothetical protein
MKASAKKQQRYQGTRGIKPTRIKAAASKARSTAQVSSESLGAALASGWDLSVGMKQFLRLNLGYAISGGRFLKNIRQGPAGGRVGGVMRGNATNNQQSGRRKRCDG